MPCGEKTGEVSKTRLVVTTVSETYVVHSIKAGRFNPSRETGTETFVT